MPTGRAALDDVETAHGDVLADLRHELEPQILDGSAVDGAAQQRLDAAPGARRSDDVGQLVDERAEVVVLGDEVGLRVDLEHDVAARLLVAANHDATLGRDARGLLVGLRGAGLAQPLGREIDVALVSTSAFLHSIMPAPVRSRSSLTKAGLISMAGVLLRSSQARSLGLGLFFAAPPSAGRFLAASVGRPFARTLVTRARFFGGGSARPSLRPSACRSRRARRTRRRPSALGNRGLAVDDGVGDAFSVELNGAHRVVVARDQVVDALGRAVRVDDGDDGNAELARLANGDFLVADVDEEHGASATHPCS